MRIIHMVIAMLVTFPAHGAEPTLKGKEKQIEGCKFAVQKLRENGHMIRESTETVVCTLEMQFYQGSKNDVSK